MKTLRPYQQNALDAIESRYAAGVRRQLLSAATGAGKSVIFAELVRRHVAEGRNCLILAHRDRLVTQGAGHIEQAIGWGNVGLVNSAAKDWWKPAVFATVQSAAGEKQLRRAPKFQTIIIDECFPPGTMIDGVPIEELKIGDRVTCYDHFTSKIRRRSITGVSRKLATALVLITLDDGSTLTCTPNHPIYIRELSRYVPAGSLRRGCSVIQAPKEIPFLYQAKNMRGLRLHVSAKKLELHDDADLLAFMQKGAIECEAESCNTSLPLVRNAYRMSGEEWVEVSRIGARVLLRPMQEKILKPQGQRFAISLQSQACIRKDEEKQSDSTARGSCQNVGKAKRPNFSIEGRQWPINRTAKVTGECAWMADGSRDRYSPGQVSIQKPAQSLQGGYWEFGIEDRGRGRRQQSQNPQVEVFRPAQDGDIAFARVDRVEILEPGSDGRFERMCADGYVYNIEVEEFHNYFANGVLVHNCHRSGSKSYRKVIESLLRPDGLLLGVTATPNRTDRKGLIPAVFDELVYEIGMRELIDQGFLCNVVGKEIRLPIDFSKLRTAVSTDGIRDYRPEDVKQAFEEAQWLEKVTAGWELVARDRRTIVFVPPGIVDGRGCGMAHSLAEFMRLRGIRAAAVDGTTPQREQDRVIADFTAGQIQVLVNVNIFTEGLDIPPIDCVLFARPTQSSIIYSQAIGRGTRTFPGKSDCLVIDITGITEELAKEGQSLMTLGKILPTEEQIENERAERRRQARDLIRRLWRKAVTLALEDGRVVAVGDVSERDRRKLDEYREEIAEILAERDGESVAAGGERKAVNGSLLHSQELEIRDIDFTRAGMRFEWEIKAEQRKALLAYGKIYFTISRPQGDDPYYIDFIGRGWRDPEYQCAPSEWNHLARTQGIEGRADTWEEAKAAVERHIAKLELQKQHVFNNPDAPWRLKPASEKQKAMLRKFKVPFGDDLTAGQASDTIDRLLKRKRA